MFEHTYDTDDAIAALATPWGTSALALIRGSGGGSLELLEKVFSPLSRLREAAGGTFLHGVLSDPVSGEPLDDVVVLVFRSPASYTGEDGFDISCHGSLPGIASILEALRNAGFRDAGPGEFTMRAFLNGKMDLTRAEAVREIVESKSRKAHSLALQRLSGAIAKRIKLLRSKLLDTAGKIELALDYPEDELDETIVLDSGPVNEVIADLKGLLSTFSTGRLFQAGARVAVCGRTNAGKSSLFNLFLKEDRSIVSEVHGTTRDYIESWINIGGIPIRLFDTAGLRDGGDAVEIEGIRRTRELIDAVDLVLYLVDAQAGVAGEDADFLNRPGNKGRTIPVWNKTDLTDGAAPAGYVPVSVVSGEGFHRLEERIAGHFLKTAYTGDEAVIDSQRQKECLESALDSLEHVKAGIENDVSLDAVAADLQGALLAFGELSGEITAAEVLDTIFSKFCVGK
ncbi:MAG: tRNA uridine-5-carboxymethylaminomethyl(34) synthesis GTPase MnmE [Spirochaetales bacterium]|nr:tRNA uridine-5-carboxymethylaminomethyl(34) synthesis GTPase MnmE [Spirochaetales bacterium]